MVIIDIKPEPIKNPKTCASCKREIVGYNRDTNDYNLMYYGHSNYVSLKGDCSAYICEYCSIETTGWIIECSCGEFL